MLMLAVSLLNLDDVSRRFRLKLRDVTRTFSASAQEVSVGVAFKDHQGDMANNDQEKTPNPVDLYVGGRVRMRRRTLGYSQEKLAEDLGLTFQQVQKYERGANRVSASKLWEIARSLSTPIGFFFDGLSDFVPQAVGFPQKTPQ